MREKQDNWERIESIVKWANMSINYFARHIGLPRGENLYQIKRGNNGISRDVADRIVDKFPQIDKLWLLTGDGVMFASDEMRSVQIPYYNIDVEHGVSLLDHLTPDANMIVPQLERCDFAMRYEGKAMGSALPIGTVVMLKAVGCETIIPGEEYVIVSRKIVTLRIVRTSGDEQLLRLVAGDRDNYDDIMLNVKDIKSVYKVIGKLLISK